MIILYEQTDLSVAIVNLAEGTSKEDALNLIPKGANYKFASYDDLPNDSILSEFSNALRLNSKKSGPCLTVDLDCAKKITKNRLRKEREQLFKINDLLLRDAILEQDDEKIIDGMLERERLRNITTLVDNANSLEELRNISVYN
jgi:hypothetical protein